MSLTPGARLGAYEIVGLIGAGGTGEVYRARDAHDGSRFSIASVNNAPQEIAQVELPVSLMIARDTNGAYTNTSPNGLLEVLQRLASAINDVQ